jgi:hypothetical protein
MFQHYELNWTFEEMSSIFFGAVPLGELMTDFEYTCKITGIRKKNGGR